MANELSTSRKDIIQNILNGASLITSTNNLNEVEQELLDIKTKQKITAARFNDQIVTPIIYNSISDIDEEITETQNILRVKEQQLLEFELTVDLDTQDDYDIKIAKQKQDFLSSTISGLRTKLVNLRKQRNEDIKLVGYKEDSVKNLVQVNNYAPTQMNLPDFPVGANYRENEEKKYINSVRNDAIDIDIKKAKQDDEPDVYGI